MKRLLSTINKAPIRITDKAWSKMINVCATENKQRFLFSATSGGCSGYNYKLELLEDIEYEKISNNKFKLTILERENCKLIIEPMSEFLLLGTIIDYISEDYSKETILFEGDDVRTKYKDSLQNSNQTDNM